MLIGPAGINTIETKTWSKPIKGKASWSTETPFQHARRVAILTWIRSEPEKVSADFALSPCARSALSIAIVPLLHMSPTHYAIGYALPVTVGATIATIVGFGAVRPFSHITRLKQLRSAMLSTGAALDAVLAANRGLRQERLLAAFVQLQNTEFLEATSNGNMFHDAVAALTALNLLALTLTLGVATRTTSADETIALVAGNLRLGDTPLPAIGEKSISLQTSLAELFLLVEYQRLREATAAM